MGAAADQPKPPFLSSRDIFAIAAIVGSGLIAWGTLTADFKALAQRVDKGEVRDEDAAKTLNTLNGSIIELRTDARAVRTEQDRQGRQLDRIEQLLRNGATYPHPAQPPLRTP